MNFIINAYLFYSLHNIIKFSTVMLANIKVEKPQKTSPKKFFDKWSMHQEIQYSFFLQEFRELLVTEYDRRVQKIFSKMSQKIKTRNAEQCRTHHQKMIKSQRTIDNILNKIEEKKKKWEIKQQIKKRSQGKRGRPPTKKQNLSEGNDVADCGEQAKLQLQTKIEEEGIKQEKSQEKREHENTHQEYHSNRLKIEFMVPLSVAF